MPFTVLNPLLRGGVHPIYGLFMGVNELNDYYTLKSTDPYKLTKQLCNAKQSSQYEMILMTDRSNVNGITFHGNLKIPTNCITECDKEGVFVSLKNQVTYHGL